MNDIQRTRKLTVWVTKHEKTGLTKLAIVPVGPPFLEEPTYLTPINVQIISAFQKFFKPLWLAARVVAGRRLLATFEPFHSEEIAAHRCGRRSCDSSDDR